MKENKTGIILLVITLIIFLGSSILIVERFRTDQTPRETVNLNEEERTRTITSDRIEEIIIRANNVNVIISSSDVNNFKLTYVEHDFLTYQFINEDNRLTISQNTRFNILAPNPNVVHNLTIEVPADKVYTLDIRSTNGYVSLANLNTNGIDVNTSNNEITLANIQNQAVTNLRTTNGEITINDLNTNELTATTSNRGIELENVEAAEISVRNVNAPISFSNLLAFDISLITSGSDVIGTIIGINGLFNKDIVTSNGTISIDDDQFGTILSSGRDQIQPLVIYTTNADITIEFRELDED